MVLPIVVEVGDPAKNTCFLQYPEPTLTVFREMICCPPESEWESVMEGELLIVACCAVHIFQSYGIML